MKRLIAILLTFILAVSMSTAVFAEENDTAQATQTDTSTQKVQLTPEQQQARDAFMKVYYDNMNKIVALRQQTKDAAEANNAISKQLKDKLKTKLNTDTITKLKDLASQRKALSEQAKQIHQQRLSLKGQYKDAVKSKDLDKMKSIEQQILDLNSQISAIKTKNDEIKTQIAPLKDDIKSVRDSNKGLRDNIKNQLQQAKTIRESIKSQEQEKTQLWNTYKENIKSKDYATAEATFNQIIEKKTAILDNLKQIGTILNQVLTSLN